MLRVLTWNLMHGRAIPRAGRDLLDEYAEALARWDWDVALLQEVPPWWPAAMAAAASAEQRTVLTSRNWLLGLRRAIAVRRPDVIKSNGGGSNAILVRGAPIADDRFRRVAWWPERRWVQAVRLANRLWVGNVHTGSYPEQGRRAAAALAEWTQGEGLVVLGGDFNVAPLALEGFSLAGGHGVDQVFVGAGLVGCSTEVLDRGSLSDHAPVLVGLIEG